MDLSEKFFDRALRSIPGGVNSPVRAFAAVGGKPPFIARARGSRLFDVDGREYIDYVGSWGAAILGHAHPEVTAAVEEAVRRGLSFGAPTAAEVLMAEKICAAIDSLEMIRMVNSGTEATMSAVRLARGFSGRKLIVKFDGCYHGHSDTLLSGAGSGVVTLGIPGSPGVPPEIAEQTIVLNYNDARQVHEAFAKNGGEIAAVIVEPVAGNMNLVPANREFLKALRECCDRHRSVLIFDEVMSGFRAAPGGAQSLYGITPDLTALGKVIGGGLPVGAFGGAAEIMRQLAPAGPVYQAGTLSGNPVAMAAGLKTLELLPRMFDSISEKTQRLVDGLNERARACGIPFFCRGCGAMFGLFFTGDKNPCNFAQVKQCNSGHFRRFFHAMLEQGIYLAPSQYEAGFVSAAHGDGDIAHTLDAAANAFKKLRHRTREQNTN